MIYQRIRRNLIYSVKPVVSYICVPIRKITAGVSKMGSKVEDTEIKNRFEIRMKNERAYYAVVDLLTYRDAERTAFSIINHYVRFVDREDDKPKSQWKTNDDWAWFIGENREPIRLTTKPEPYTLQKALHWLQETGCTNHKNGTSIRQRKSYDDTERYD